MIKIQDCMYQPAMWLGDDDKALLYRINMWNGNHIHHLSRMPGNIECHVLHSDDCYADRSWNEPTTVKIVSKLRWADFVEAVKAATTEWGGFIEIVIPLRRKPGCMGYGCNEDSAMLAWREKGVWHSNL